jgi:hypothetical protein
LKDIGLDEHASMFEENEIIGEHLLDFGNLKMISKNLE